MSSPGRRGGWRPAPLTRTSAHESSMRWTSPPSWCSPPSRSTSSPSARISTFATGAPTLSIGPWWRSAHPTHASRRSGSCPSPTPSAPSSPLKKRSPAAWPRSGCRRKLRATSRRRTLTWTRCGPDWPRRASRSCSTSGGASCFPRLSTTTDCPAQRTGSVEARISGPRTFRWCITLPSVSWLAWLSTGFSSAIRTCMARPSSWVPRGCRDMLRNVDYAHRSFSKFEPALKALPLLPSEYLRRQVRFTPFLV